MMRLSEKLARLKSRRGLTTDALSLKSGVPKGTINKLLNGETRNPTIGTLKALAGALECPLEWLSVEGPAAVPPPQPADIPGVRRLGDAREDHWFDNLMPVLTRRVPLLGSIAAGEPILAEQELAVADCDAGSLGDFARRGKGDSVIGARIHDGDVVFIRRQDDVADGQIAAVVIDDVATLKRVYHVKNGLQLLSENPKDPPMMCTRNECGAIRILGLAVGFTGIL